MRRAPLSEAASAQNHATPQTRPSTGGFTLIELVMAIAIIGASFLGLLVLRASAVDKAWVYNTERHAQRIAQEKLDEVVFGIEEGTSGSIDEEGFEDWTWEVEVYSLATTDTNFPLLECSLTLFYTAENNDEPEEYFLATRFFAHETHPLREFADTLDNGTTDTTTGF